MTIAMAQTHNQTLACMHTHARRFFNNGNVAALVQLRVFGHCTSLHVDVVRKFPYYFHTVNFCHIEKKSGKHSNRCRKHD